MAEPKNPPVIPTSQSRPSSEPPDEGWAELETTIEVSPSNRQVALEQAVTFAVSSVTFEGHSVDQVLATADRFHNWLTQDEEERVSVEPVEVQIEPLFGTDPQVGLGATSHHDDD